jgi:hypothetical protein
MPEAQSTATPAIELHQTRDFTKTERHDLIELWRKLLWEDRVGTGYNVLGYAWYGFGGFLALSAWMSISRLWSLAPMLAAQLAFALVGFAISVALVQWMYRRFERDGYWRHPSVGDRFVIAADGFRQIRPNAAFAYDWRGIERLICNDRYVACICSDRAVLFAKAAFADQDVDGFCAELERRWHEGRRQAA